MPEPLTPEEFRAEFPAFTEQDYTDRMLAPRLELANQFFDEKRWGAAMRKHAMALYAAHFLELGGKAGASGSGSALGGTGVIASKSVDSVSVSYDNSVGAEEGAGFWNSTRYGRELWMLIRLYGAGMAFVI